MVPVTEEGALECDAQDSGAQEEKISVAVRLRPLNAKELAKNDVSNWECINNTTIIFRNTLQDRSLAPTAYTFDRVFGSNCSTRQVYEEAVKKIALSVLSGINSTIFAYGQTSSGKTYTMSGITEYAVADIYDYIKKHPERDFVVKFSALEIYNELVKDLLCPDGAPLRLLDDPEKGTIVEKLTGVILRDSDHLFELLSFCEAQRQTGETSLNERSSRSHQILRLTIESEAHEYFGVENSSTLAATVNFVDLAGSERASQTLSCGTRLKEGSHINRSLLTLGTVIRQLSKGRNGHIPYRNSKLTRILQNSLGGNARTAIICTSSPAHCHVEQSKSTLVFATCAKNVSTNARVNVALSEKALVKQLQGKLTKMENELRNLRAHSASSVSATKLREKELLIAKMENEIKEVTHQRDLALSHVESLLRPGGLSQASLGDMNYPEKASEEYSASEASEIYDPHRSDVAPSAVHLSSKFDGLISGRIEDQFPENHEEQFLSGNISPTQYFDKYFGPDPSKDWEKLAQETSKKFADNCKDVQYIEVDLTNTDPVAHMPPAQKGSSPCSPDNNPSNPGVSASRRSSFGDILTTISSPSFEVPKDNKDTEADNQAEQSIVETVINVDNVCIVESAHAIRRNSMEEQTIVTLNEDCEFKQEDVCVKEVNEVIPPGSVTQTVSDMGMEDEITTNKPKPEEAAELGFIESLDEKTLSKPEPGEPADFTDTQDRKQSATDWSTEFIMKTNEIFNLWDACNIPLVHRTYFFMLFRGDDPSDAVYLEVELRRLSFLKNSMNGATKDDPSFTQNSSARALSREREMLSRRMLRKFSSKEREELYMKWGIDINSRQRRVQLCQKLWTDTTNMDHISESAAIVAKLVGFKASGQAAKEMFGLSFLPRPGAISWKDSLPSLMQGLLETV